MKKLFILWALITVGLLPLGCAPSEQAPPAVEATPTPDEAIADMDFESGGVEQAETADETAAESKPDGH
ncbi:MAG: hypothetical protein LJE93_14255 [Acidobacteria bacterium]|jgi:hypothetical protein|nr:hypothetical protein [Acidobacteriota bacterium]